MPGPGGILTLDLSSRATGWAYGELKGDVSYGLWKLPGLAEIGDLYARVRNATEDAITLHRPRRVVFCIPLMKEYANAKALICLAGIVELVCHDESVPYCNEVAEGSARKEILGRGSFTVYRDGRPIKGTGTERAKIAVMEWAHNKGWKPQTHDVGDALVILEYARRWDLAHRQWGEAA